MEQRSWYKVTFLQGEDPFGRPLHLTGLAEERDQAAGQLQGFAIFIENDENACPVLYFSPVAAAHCADLLVSWGANPCEPPIIKETFPADSPAYGSL
jgi:hypothetical protein